MTLIYLVRHGETLFNTRQLVQGWVDSPLTDRGWQQARQAAEQLGSRPLAAVYSSTSERAMDTAGAIAGHHEHLEVQIRRGLKEFHFGQYEAIPAAQLYELVDIPTYFGAVVTGMADALPGGETGAQFRERIDRTIAEIVAAHPTGEVVVVSHGVTINAVLITAGWRNPGPVPNASISVMRMQPGQQPEVVAVGLSGGLESVWKVPAMVSYPEPGGARPAAPDGR